MTPQVVTADAVDELARRIPAVLREEGLIRDDELPADSTMEGSHGDAVASEIANWLDGEAIDHEWGAS